MPHANGRPRRLLMLINNLGPAGAEIQLVHLAAGLAQRGHDVTVACQRGARISLEPLEREGVRLVMFGATNPREKARMLPRLVRLARGADVVYCSMWDASLWGRLAALLARRPVVVAEHTAGRDRELSQTTGKPRASWIGRSNRVLDPFTYATVACADWQVPLLLREGVAETKIVQIPNGVPVDEIVERSEGGVTRAELGIPEDAKVLVHVARFQPQKNQPATLEVVRRLREDLGDVHVIFPGRGPLWEEVKAQARALGADWAHFLGQRGDIPAVLRLSDVFVLPSLAEAMPMAIIEALAVGVPVIASDVGDVRLVLERTGGGIVIPPGDVDAYEEACRRVLSDPQLRTHLADTGRAGARDLFDSGRMVERYEALLDAAAERGPVPVLS